jgi:hypothetical protein
MMMIMVMMILILRSWPRSPCGCGKLCSLYLVLIMFSLLLQQVSISSSICVVEYDELAVLLVYDPEIMAFP